MSQEELELTPSERFITEYHEDGRCVLTIKDITFDDEAEYTCQAKNQAGVSSTFVDIFVESKSEALSYIGIPSLPCSAAKCGECAVGIRERVLMGSC